jgi:hypothetical protein
MSFLFAEFQHAEKENFNVSHSGASAESARLPPGRKRAPEKKWIPRHKRLDKK